MRAAVATDNRECGRHADGGGLYLSISPNGGRRWVFLYRWHGKPTEVGLGSARDVHAGNRARAGWRRPAPSWRRESIQRTSGSRPEGATFGECADRLIESHAARLGATPSTAAQWDNDLAKSMPRLFGGCRWTQIGTDDVLSVLKPLWSKKHETASRLRGRIERVLDAAKAQGLRQRRVFGAVAGSSGSVPAEAPAPRARAPRRPALRRGAGIHGRSPGAAGPAAAALELTVLTAARSGETLLAKKTEFDIDRAVWTVPPARMKAGREHRVPLSRRALKIVKQAMADYPDSDFLFPGQKPGKPLSAMALEMMLRRMKVKDATVHGFRSSFRDWASECTNFSNEVCEAALAHVIKDKAEAAYRRGDLFEKRRKLMEAWAVYCTAPKAGKVIAFRR